MSVTAAWELGPEVVLGGKRAAVTAGSGFERLFATKGNDAVFDFVGDSLGIGSTGLDGESSVSAGESSFL